MSTADLVIVCLSVAGCYAMYLFSVHEQSRALKLALDTNEDVVAEAAKIRDSNALLVAEAGKHKETVIKTLLEHNERLHVLEDWKRKVVMR
jgi:hypothetical protein